MNELDMYKTLQRQSEYEAAETQRKEKESIDKLISIIARMPPEDVETCLSVRDDLLVMAEEYGSPAIAALWIVSLELKNNCVDMCLREQIEKMKRKEDDE